MLTPLHDSPEEKRFLEGYFRTTPDNQPNHLFTDKAEPGTTDIYVPTFNNSWLIEYQIKTLRKFFQAPFNLIVVDNNNWLHPESSEEVLSICQRENVAYLKAPDNLWQKPENFDSSMKLGTTLSWLFYNCIKPRNPKYFGFLDHDCFLFEPFDIRPYLDEKGMYGRICKRDNDHPWNLHVTCNFFKTDFVRDVPLDFRVSHKYALDTGGANYDVLYHRFSHENYRLGIRGVFYSGKEGLDINRKDSVQHYEIIDERWYHMAASTHDQLAGDGEYKRIYTRGWLDCVLIK
jgi:hypothetical protein